MYSLVRKILFQMQPETAHNVTMRILSGLPASGRWLTSPAKLSSSLRQNLWGLDFPHPIGLAAGLDKNGVAVDGLFHCGFAFVEVGTVTPLPQLGNPKPRMFRLLDDQAIINRMGFNNHGATALYQSLQKHKRPGVVGINIGKNKVTANDDAISDYLKCMDTLSTSADYIVINVSSPNTPGLRDLQNEETIVPLAKAVIAKRDEIADRSERVNEPNKEGKSQHAPNHAHHRTSNASGHRPPVLLKLAPDLADEAIEVLGRGLMNAGIDGFIATNTTIRRDGLHSQHQGETGGLSGRPLQTRSTDVVRILYQATEGRVPIIGSGGIFTAQDAYEKIRAGASLVQVYTGFIYEGPALIHRLTAGISDLLRRDGFASVQEAIGVDTRVQATR